MIGWGGTTGPWVLADGMARTAGLDLPGAVLEGWLRRDELGQIVTRCAACGSTVDCAGWIGRRARDALPGFCANKAEIEALAI